MQHGRDRATTSVASPWPRRADAGAACAAHGGHHPSFRTLSAHGIVCIDRCLCAYSLCCILEGMRNAFRLLGKLARRLAAAPPDGHLPSRSRLAIVSHRLAIASPSPRHRQPLATSEKGEPKCVQWLLDALAADLPSRWRGTRAGESIQLCMVCIGVYRCVWLIAADLPAAGRLHALELKRRLSSRSGRGVAD